MPNVKQGVGCQVLVGEQMRTIEENQVSCHLPIVPILQRNERR
jgi:hypothetical protein